MSIQYRGAVYREVNALWGFGKKDKKPANPQQQDDKKAMGEDKAVAEQQRLAKIGQAAMNAYMELKNFFNPMVNNAIGQFDVIFAKATPRAKKIELATKLLSALGGYINHVNTTYKNDSRPEKKKIYTDFAAKFKSGNPAAPIVQFVETLKSFEK